MSTQDTAALIESVNNMTATVAGKMGEIDKEVSDAKKDFEAFKVSSDNRYALQKRNTQLLRVDGDQNYWYPVLIQQPNGASFYLRRYVNADSGTYGNWNGTLEFHFRANDREYGGNYGYVMVDMYLVSGKSASRILPDADIPFIGRLSSNVGPYNVCIWLRGNTSYDLGSDFAGLQFSIGYSEVESPAGYENPAPIAIADGVHASVPAVGYIRGEVTG